MTKAYQVFKGEDHLGFTYYEHQATYFNQDQALEHCKRIVESDEFKDEQIAEYTVGNKKLWNAHGWEILTVCKLEEIEII
jgi:hypothetical protein